ncbi:MAG: ABC transporter permease [Caldilineaceae bacterium]|nr:ABC transporter permease [Caldilineaceae bacterium]HRJ43172.1 ABC transporter permease [Caldilineaceae bacterium]
MTQPTRSDIAEQGAAGDAELEEIYRGAAAVDVPPEEWASLSQWQLIWRRFKRSRPAMIGGILLLLMYLSAIFCEFISPYQLDTRFTENIYAPPTLPHFIDSAGQFHLRPFIYKQIRTINRETLEMSYEPDPTVMYPIHFFGKGVPYKFWGLIPTDRHLFGVDPEVPIFLLGSDRQGRDMFSRTLFGARISLSVGLLGVFIGIILGSVLGVISGYYGGLVDDLMQRFSELLISIPQIPLWMALAAILPVTWSAIRVYFGITIILSLLNWGGLARQVRGKTLALREEGYTLAARAAGASDWWIISRHLIPNNGSHIIVVATLSIPYMILGETALSFLGLGIRAPMTSWGVLLEEAQNVRTIIFYPWLIMPAVLVIVAVLGFNFLGDGLRDAVDPYSK